MRQLFATRAMAIVVAAILCLCAALPVAAQSASDRAALDKLFDQLKAAANAEAADIISQQIWQIWTGPSDKVLAGRMQTVITAEQSGDLAGALTLLQGLVTDYPDYAEGWNQRATVEYEMKNYAASLSDIGRVLALEPRHFGALSGKVLVYLAMGDRNSALAAMLAALAVDPFLAEKALFPELNQPAVNI